MAELSYLDARAESLPSDYQQTLERLSHLGWPAMSPERLQAQAEESIADVLQSAVSPADLGLFDGSAVVLIRIEEALREHLCVEGKLHPNVRPFLTGELGAENIEYLSHAVSVVILTIHPALHVSRVILYVAFWLSRVGLDNWCAMNRQTGAGQ